MSRQTVREIAAETESAVAWNAASSADSENLNGKEIIARPMEASEAVRLWDQFWGTQSKPDGLVHSLIWLTRRILSRIHANQMLQHAHSRASLSAQSAAQLEVGCGSAETTRRIRKSIGAKAVVVDISLPAVRLARRLDPELMCIVADAQALPFAEGRFTLCFSSGVLEHFERSVASRMLYESCRVTSRRGTVGVIVPWKHTPYNLLRILSGKRWPFGDEDPFTRPELRDFVKSVGLTEIGVYGTFWTTLTAIGTRSGEQIR